MVRSPRTPHRPDRRPPGHIPLDKVHDTPAPDGGALGEIYVLAVDPAFLGRGLGRAIALDGLDYLARHRHATRAILYVDSANVAAVNLYRRLGFTTERTDRAYRWTSC